MNINIGRRVYSLQMYLLRQKKILIKPTIPALLEFIHQYKIIVNCLNKQESERAR